jgi:hypothetical protein
VPRPYSPVFASAYAQVDNSRLMELLASTVSDHDTIQQPVACNTAQQFHRQVSKSCRSPCAVRMVHRWSTVESHRMRKTQVASRTRRR